MPRILAIDPGSTETGYVMLDGESIKEKGKIPNERMLEIVSWKGEFYPGADVVAIELIGHYGTGMPAGQTVFDACIWIGRYLQAFKAHSTNPVFLIKRSPIKAHHCFSAKAKDAHVRQALVDRLGEPGTKKNPGPTYGITADVWQALALGLYVHDNCTRPGVLPEAK